MKYLILALSLVAFALPVFSQTPAQLQPMTSSVVPTNDSSHQPYPMLPTFSRGFAGLNDQVTLSVDPLGTGYTALWDQSVSPPLHYGLLKAPALTTNTVLWTFPNASGTILTTAASQTLTTPVIAGGLTASGSGSINFSGSTASFLYPTGGVRNNYAAYNASGAGTVTLTAAQSGQTFLFDGATGIVYTLPAPSVGLTYTFQVSVSVTSNSHEVRTNTGTVFVVGSIAQIGSATTFGFLANGSSNQAYKSNGTTTGGLIGTQLTFTCVSATKWMVSGINVASGTASTPFTDTP